METEEGKAMGAMLSSHFSEREFLFSQTARKHALDNQFRSPTHRENARALCQRFLERIRKAIDRPITITSGYRTPALNILLGGSRRSAHLTGQAVDFYSPGQALADTFNTIIQLRAQQKLPAFDQLIWEGTWIHLGIMLGTESQPREQVLMKQSSKTGLHYVPIQWAPAL